MSTTSPPRLLYSADDVAAATALPVGTIRRLMRSGDLKAEKVGRRVLVHVDDLQAFADAVRRGDVDYSEPRRATAKG